MLPLELLARSADLPWLPTATPGKSLKLLCCLEDDRGFVELLRMEPGVRMPLHRHTGEIHAYNLSGSRQLCTGEIVGPGDYVYEPPGNTDSWQAVGDAPMVAFIVVMGAVEFLGADGTVLSTASADSMRRQYAARVVHPGGGAETK
ncbi:MAG: cupin domain-containing protein [Arenimonas sp.]|jgi:quercetin dioxygenase-like cupin family protein